jgi:hypothetical protein
MTVEEYIDNANKTKEQLSKIEALKNKVSSANDNVERCNSILNWKAPRGYNKKIDMNFPQFIAYSFSIKDGSCGEQRSNSESIILADGMAEDLLNNLKDYYVNKANNAKLELIEYLKSIGITDINMNDAMFGKNK